MMPELADLKQAFHEVLEERYGRTPTEVRVIFDWAVLKMEKEKRCAIRRQKIIDGVLGSTGIFIITGMLISTGEWGRTLLSNIWKHLMGG